MDISDVNTSDKGIIKNIPGIPKVFGNINMKGIMKNITLEAAKNILVLFFPIDWKYIADTTFIPAKGKAYITNLNPCFVILKSCMSCLLNIDIIWSGKI